jgi:hypothetical protein
MRVHLEDLERDAGAQLKKHHRAAVFAQGRDDTSA